MGIVTITAVEVSATCATPRCSSRLRQAGSRPRTCSEGLTQRRRLPAQRAAQVPDDRATRPSCASTRQPDRARRAASIASLIDEAVTTSRDARPRSATLEAPGRRRDVHGILLLDKPRRAQLREALARVKRLFTARKAGHTGILDPLASGHAARLLRRSHQVRRAHCSMRTRPTAYAAAWASVPPARIRESAWWNGATCPPWSPAQHRSGRSRTSARRIRRFRPCIRPCNQDGSRSTNTPGRDEVPRERAPRHIRDLRSCG